MCESADDENVVNDARVASLRSDNRGGESKGLWAVSGKMRR